MYQEVPFCHCMYWTCPVQWQLCSLTFLPCKRWATWFNKLGLKLLLHLCVLSFTISNPAPVFLIVIQWFVLFKWDDTHRVEDLNADCRANSLQYTYTTLLPLCSTTSACSLCQKANNNYQSTRLSSLFFSGEYIFTEYKSPQEKHHLHTLQVPWILVCFVVPLNIHE